MLEILIYRTWAINFPVIHKRNLKNALTIVTESVTNELLNQASFQGLTRLPSPGHGNSRDNGDEQVVTL